MNYFVPWGIALCLCFFVLPAQTTPDSLARKNTALASTAPISSAEPLRLENQSFFSAFLHDEGEIWSSPFRISRDQAEVWGGVTLATALVITVDEPISRDVYRFRNEHLWVQTVSPIATQFGQFYVPYSIAVLSCLDGVAFNDDERLETGLLEVQAMFHSGIVVQVLKHLFGRSRPFIDNGKSIWYGPRVIIKRYEGGGFSPYDSFPSGHTITAFSLAEVIAERERPWVGVVAYTCAGLCGISRLTQHDHFLSDVVLGGALGVAIGKFEVESHEKNYTISPTVGLGSAGVSIQFN